MKNLAHSASFRSAEIAPSYTEIKHLAGDETVTLADLAAEISRQTDRDIPYIDVPQAEYAAMLERAGLPGSLADSLAAWDVDAANGALFDDSRQLSKLIGRPTTPLAQAIRAAIS